MSDNEMKSERPRAYDLIQAFKDAELKGNESKAIGEMLVEFFETESNLDACIAGWFYPVNPERYDPMHEHILIYTPLNKKLEAARDLEILPKSTVDKFFKIANQRNSLAHRRTRAKRLKEIISEESKDKFISDCRDIRSAITDRMRTQVEELKIRYKEIYMTIPNEFIKYIIIKSKSAGSKKEGA